MQAAFAEHHVEQPRVHGDPLHGRHLGRGVLAAAAADRQVDLLRVAGQRAALLRVAGGAGLDRRLRAAPGEPAADRAQRPRQALGAQEPLPPRRARRADDGLPRRAGRLHPPRPGHLASPRRARCRPRRPPATRRRSSARPSAAPSSTCWSRSWRAFAEARPAYDPAQFVDVDVRRRSSRTRSAPPAASTTRSASTGRPRRPAAVEAIDRESRQGGQRPSHRYSLADYGLTEDRGARRVRG